MTTASIVFSDVVGSSAIVHGAGGPAAMVDHVRSLADVCGRHGARLVKSTGDGVMALFDSAPAAMHAAVAMQQTTHVLAAGSGRPIAVRVGVHIGEVLDADPLDGEPDAFGPALVVARRLCDAADGGVILASDLIRQIVGDRPDLMTVPAGALELKGVPHLVEVCEVAWSPPAAVRPTVVVADDVALVRTGVARLLAGSGFEVVAEAGDLDALLDAVRHHRPTLLVTDIRMPPGQSDEGLRAAAVLRAERPDLAVMVVSQHVEPGAAALLLDGSAGAIGYLLKERVGDLDEFVDACRTVAAGGTVIDPVVTERLVGAGPASPVSRLTEAERSVLDLMAQGRSNGAIARTTLCSVKTVESHVRSIFLKLDLEEHPDDNRRVAAVVAWLHALR